MLFKFLFNNLCDETEIVAQAFFFIGKTPI